MPPVSVPSLVKVFSQVPDGRDPRGVRHLLPSLLTLVFLGMLARIREMTVLQRWAEAHWDELREPLGFSRKCPHATTISRALAKCSVADFSRAFLAWVQQMIGNQPLVAAVDGKTSCQGHDAEGHPIQTLTVLVHQLKVVVGQWSLSGEKTNEPVALRRHLAELLENFPLLQLITGDAIYAQRPLAQALLDENCDYLVQIKGNQKDIEEALHLCLGDVHERPPAAQTVEKRGTSPISAGCGSTWTTPITFAIRSTLPGARSPCVLIGT